MAQASAASEMSKRLVAISRFFVPFALSEYAAFSKKSKCAEQLTKQFGKMISETRSRYDYYALQSKYKQLFTMSMADKD